MKRPANLAAFTAVAAACTQVLASSHREAPITALDRTADITDVYAFVSYGPDQQANASPSKVTLIMCVDPLLEPGNGPIFFPFDPDVEYQINIDNNNDAKPDVAFRFRFNTEFQLPDVPVALIGAGDGATDPETGAPVVPPKIKSFDNPGLNLRQTYTVTMLRRGDRRNVRGVNLANDDGSPFFAVPADAGPRTIDYEAVFDAGTYSLSNGVSVFAGTVDDPFFIDLGAAFDTVNLRTLGSGVPGVLTEQEDSAEQNFAPDFVSGYAVNAIAIEVPIEMLTQSGAVEPATSPAATIGVWATTSRPRVTIRRSPNPAQNSERAFRQVQRMGNPLINELLVGIGSKDRWSLSEPADDQQFLNFYLSPVFPQAVEALYAGALQVPEGPREDLRLLLQYGPPIAAPGTPSGPIADLLRLNTGVPPTPAAQASRLGVLGGDLAGFPNGRRLFDDVTDIALRVVVGGVLVDPAFPGFQAGINGRLGDGVNVNNTPRNPIGSGTDAEDEAGRGFRTAFPYLANSPSGRNRRHIDPGEEFPDGRRVPIDSINETESAAE